MTDNAKLIEEARIAFIEAWEAEDRRVENEDRDARGTHSRSRAGVVAALSVFEKAHTPTDDEREALIDAEGWPVADVVDVVMTRWSNDNDQIRRNVGGWAWRSLASSAIQSLAQDGLLRRSEVPEPSGVVDDPSGRLFRSHTYKALAERDFTGHMDEGRRTAFYEGWSAREQWESTRPAQGEPSDAQVDAERRAAYRREHRAELMRQERAALRAARGAR